MYIKWDCPDQVCGNAYFKEEVAYVMYDYAPYMCEKYQGVSGKQGRRNKSMTPTRHEQNLAKAFSFTLLDITLYYFSTTRTEGKIGMRHSTLN